MNSLKDIEILGAPHPTPCRLFVKGNALSVFTGVIFFVMLLVLPGCQLALENAGHQENARLIGVFITTEHIDLFEHTQIDHIPTRWGQPDFSELLRPGRLYAEWCVEFRFPGVEGIPFFTAMSPPMEDTHLGRAITTHGGSSISGGHNHVHFDDNSVNIEMEGIIYAVPGAQAFTVLYMNPVFQTADGRVFLESGSGSSFHGMTTEGHVFSQNLTETTTITENGVETTNSISVTVQLVAMFPPESIYVLQMDADSSIVARTIFMPNEMPEMLQLEAQTEYVIVETHRSIPPDAYGTSVIRELVTQNDHRISTFMAREDGILEKSWTEIVWAYE